MQPPTHTTVTPGEPITEPTKDVSVEKPHKLGGLFAGWISFVILCFTVIGTAVAWAQYHNGGVEKQVSLWRIWQEDQGVVTITTPAQLCPSLENRFKAAASFAIVAIFGSLMSMILSFVYKGTSYCKTAALVFLGSTIVSTLITWGIGVDVYYHGYCGFPSLNDQHFQIYAGAALFVSSFALAIVAFGLLHWDPPAVYGEELLRVSTIAFTVMMSLTLVFVVVGTPIKQIVREDSVGTTSLSLWQNVTVSQVTTPATTTTIWLSDIKNCDMMVQRVRASQAFAILSIAAALLGVVFGVLTLFGHNLRFLAFFGGFAACCFSVATWGLVAKIYGGDWCNAAVQLHQNDFIFAEGFALFVTAFVTSLIACSQLLYFTVQHRLSQGKKATPLRPMAVIFVICMAVAFVMCCVGASMEIAYNYYYTITTGPYTSEITWWHVRVQSDTSTTQQSIDSAFSSCGIITHSYKTGQAFTILSCVFTFFALLTGINQLGFEQHRYAAAASGFIAMSFQLITWALGVAMYMETFCDSNLKQLGYKIGAGIGLYIASFCITVVASALNLVFA